MIMIVRASSATKQCPSSSHNKGDSKASRVTPTTKMMMYESIVRDTIGTLLMTAHYNTTLMMLLYE